MDLSREPLIITTNLMAMVKYKLSDEEYFDKTAEALAVYIKKNANKLPSKRRELVSMVWDNINNRFISVKTYDDVFVLMGIDEYNKLKGGD